MAMVLAVTIAGCESTQSAVESVTEAVQNTVGDIMTYGGVVRDTRGKALEGVTVKAYSFSDNLNAFGPPDQEIDVTDPSTYKVKVHMGKLRDDGKVAKETTTDKDGKWTLDGLSLDGYIIVADRTKYSDDIAGMDQETGEISFDSVQALVPTMVAGDTITAIELKNDDIDFVLAGGPIVQCEADDDCEGYRMYCKVEAGVEDLVADKTCEKMAPECDEATPCENGQICAAEICQNECGEEPAIGCDADGSLPACKADTNTCVQCLGDSDCSDGRACDITTNTCVECTDDSYCNAEGLGVCKAQTCVACIADDNCANDQRCDVDNSVCIAQECALTQDCKDLGVIGVCTGDAHRTCQAECGAEAGDATCDEPFICKEGRCEVECKIDADCADNANGGVCSPENNRCVGCVVDTQCMATEICNAETSECQAAECDDASACDTGVCTGNEHGRCEPGCTEDSDCTETDPNKICSAELQRCAYECEIDTDCDAGKICDIGMTFKCIEQECDSTQACRDADLIGVCDLENGHGRCASECKTDIDCESGSVCNTAIEVCEPEECADDSGCTTDGKIGICQSPEGDTHHGRCVAECSADTDCATGKICDAAVARCIDEICADDAGCQVEGQIGICQSPEGDTHHGRCVAECAADTDCPSGKICDEVGQRCVDQECASVSDCIEAEKLGRCAGGTDGSDEAGASHGRCIPECGEDPMEGTCAEGFACDVPAARCVDVNILFPPADPKGWTTFVITDESDNVLVDVLDSQTDGRANIDIMSEIVKNGGVIRIKGEVDSENEDIKKAWLKVQYGDSECATDEGLPPKTDVIELTLENGKIVSDKGEFFTWYLSGGYEQLQLIASDADEMSPEATLYESPLASVDDECAPPAHDLTLYFSWDKDRVDMDLHVWNSDGERTFYASKFDGKYKQSSYGVIDVDDRNGFGPEVFTLNQGEEGKYKVRVHFFSGPRKMPDYNPVTITVRSVWRDQQGEWHDETKTMPVAWRKWGEVGIFEVGARPASE
ncbi:MAG: hypothetical protein VX589_05195 [Myxococcota bacterium]|nr:hypothetical protein [Myxococcota bacterium]